MDLYDILSNAFRMAGYECPPVPQILSAPPQQLTLEGLERAAWCPIELIEE